MKTLKNNQGMSIVTALVGAAIGIIVMAGLTTMITTVFKSQRTAQTRDAHREVALAIRQLLVDPTICTASFRNGDPRGTTGFTRTQIRDDGTPPEIKYQTGVPYLNNLVTITNFRMKEFVQDVPTNDKVGKAELLIEMDKIGDIVGSRSLVTKIYVQATLNNGYNVIDCSVLGSADSLWLISPFDPNNIFYGLGRVGVGASDPISKFHVGDDNGRQISSGNSTVAWADMSSSGNGTGVFGSNVYKRFSDNSFRSSQTHASIGSRGLAINYPAWGDQTFFTVNGATTADTAITPTNLMTIKSGGNVGIGTTAPTQKLDVVGNIQTDYLLVNPAAGSAIEGGELRLIGAGANGNIQLDNYNGHFRVHTLADGKHFQILGGTLYSEGKAGSNFFASNVGIGTPNPTYKLEVDGSFKTSGADFNLLDDGDVNTTAVRLFSNSGRLYLQNGDGDGIYLRNKTAGVNMVVQNDGKVGIGTTTLTKKLEVSGDGNFTGRLSVGNKAQADGVAATTLNGTIIAATSSSYSVAIGENNIDERGLGIFYGTQQRGSFFEREIPPYNRALIMKNHWGGHLAFMVTNDTNTVVYTPMVVDATQRFVGIGQGAPGNLPVPSYQLDVYGDISSRTQYVLNGVVICPSASCGGASDRRLKKDIKPLTSSLEKILKLQGVSYHWKDPKKFGPGEHIGFIAQEVEKVFPEVINHDKAADIKSVSYQHLVAPVVEALKALFARLIEVETTVKELLKLTEDDSRKIASLEKDKVSKVDFDKLKSENEMLKKENEDIKSRLEKLEKLLQSK